MSEMTKARIEQMTPLDIAGALRRAAKFEREHIAITWEHGTDLVNIVAVHGDKIAAAIERDFE